MEIEKYEYNLEREIPHPGIIVVSQVQEETKKEDVGGEGGWCGRHRYWNHHLQHCKPLPYTPPPLPRGWQMHKRRPKLTHAMTIP